MVLLTSLLLLDDRDNKTDKIQNLRNYRLEWALGYPFTVFERDEDDNLNIGLEVFGSEDDISKPVHIFKSMLDDSIKPLA